MGEIVQHNLGRYVPLFLAPAVGWEPVDSLRGPFDPPAEKHLLKKICLLTTVSHIRETTVKGGIKYSHSSTG